MGANISLSLSPVIFDLSDSDIAQMSNRYGKVSSEKVQHFSDMPLVLKARDEPIACQKQQQQQKLERRSLRSVISEVRTPPHGSDPLCSHTKFYLRKKRIHPFFC
ncbi:hypothetical protein MHYP_G00340120 [Metynnis hypsauchen]